MAFNVTSSKGKKELPLFELNGSGWSVSNVRVLSTKVVSFTLKMRGLALYNMRLVDTGDKIFIANGQSKGSDGNYYDNYAIYLSQSDKELIIEAVKVALEELEAK